MDWKEAGQKWEALHKNWVFANQEARRMECKNMLALQGLRGG